VNRDNASVTLKRAGRALRSARKAEQYAYERARMTAIAAVAVGVPEAVAARELGVDRMTVRKWMGKR
jgi:transcriptional regulator of acetoin/glycerol metabolism